MQIFMIEWWDQEASIWKQEYYTKAENAFARFVSLRDDVAGSSPDISTVTTQD